MKGSDLYYNYLTIKCKSNEKIANNLLIHIVTYFNTSVEYIDNNIFVYLDGILVYSGGCNYYNVTLSSDKRGIFELLRKKSYKYV